MNDAVSPVKWISGLTEFTLVNGLSGDPCLYTFFSKSGDAVLFDLGDVTNLSHKALLKARTVCISHTHIDHFIGFDRVLRINIPHFKELEVCGPVGIAKNIQGKFRGYLWNLVEQDQIKVRVHEIGVNGDVSSFEIANIDQFEIRKVVSPVASSQLASRPLPEKPACFVTNLSDSSRIEAVALDHGTPSIAYLCQAPLRFVVKTAELDRLGLEPGPWIRELQTLIGDAIYNKTITVGNKQWKSGELAAEVLNYTAPRNVGYVTDIVFSWENLKRLKLLMLDVETLVCECNYKDEDRAKAFAKKHLTTKQAALIAAYVKADHLQVFHISKIYKDDVAPSVEEARKFFESFKVLDEEALINAIEAEINLHH